MQIHARERGFTLIEMITVIAISVFILGILFANFRSWGGTANVDEDAQEIASLIRQARQDSISVRQYGAGYPSYGVYVTTAAPAGRIKSQVFIYTDKDTADTTYFFDKMMPEANPKGNSVVQDVALSPGVTVSSIKFTSALGATETPGNASVLFQRPEPITYITKEVSDNQIHLGSGTLEITITATSGETRKITVNSVGHVTIGY